MFERVGIFARRDDPRVAATLRRLVQMLEARGVAVGLDPVAREILLDLPDCPPPFTLGGTPGELLIAVGGDGTLLRATECIGDTDTPVLGVNLGRLGFLADLSPADLERRLPEILAGRFVEDRRIRLDWSVHRGGEVVARGRALNDVVVEKWNSPRLITVELSIDGAFVNEQRCDGLIVATPTGSTAYALSGGGPILEAGLGVLSIVPICPHNLSNRPIVIDGAARISLRVESSGDSNARVTSDGRDHFALGPGDRLVVARAPHAVRLIHPVGYEYYATLRAKLHWGRSPC
jgi:NAD+ kinase